MVLVCECVCASAETDNLEIPYLGMNEEGGFGELVCIVKSNRKMALFPGNTSIDHLFLKKKNTNFISEEFYNYRKKVEIVQSFPMQFPLLLTSYIHVSHLL